MLRVWNCFIQIVILAYQCKQYLLHLFSIVDFNEVTFNWNLCFKSGIFGKLLIKPFLIIFIFCILHLLIFIFVKIGHACHLWCIGSFLFIFTLFFLEHVVGPWCANVLKRNFHAFHLVIIVFWCLRLRLCILFIKSFSCLQELEKPLLSLDLVLLLWIVLVAEESHDLLIHSHGWSYRNSSMTVYICRWHWRESSFSVVRQSGFFALEVKSYWLQISGRLV